MNTPERRTAIRERLIGTYDEGGLWGETNPAWALPEGIERGTDEHLAFLTLVYAISGVDILTVPVSPAAELALEGLEIEGRKVSAAVFGPLDALGRLGCRQRPSVEGVCPVAEECPVAGFCRYGHDAKTT